MLRVRVEGVRPWRGTPPVVSVVVPCYNYGHFLPQAVSSILEQGVPVEVIIVDDCSTDDSAEIAAALGAQHSQVHVIVNERNLGHIATYNTGLGMVTGEYVVLLSADDMLAPDSLLHAISVFERHPAVGLVYGYAERFTDVRPPGWSTGTASVWSGSTWIDLICRRGDNAIINPEAVMRTSLLRRLGRPYDPSSPHAADMMLWLRAALVSDVARVNRVQGYYRTHASQMHLTTYAGAAQDMRARADVFESLFGGGGVAPHPVRRRWGVRSIEREAAWRATLARRAGDAAEGAEYERLARSITRNDLTSVVWRLNPGPAGGRLLEMAYGLKWNLKSRRWRWLGI